MDLLGRTKTALSKYYLHGTLALGLLVLCLVPVLMQGPLLPVGITVGGLLIVGSWAKMALAGYIGREIDWHESKKRADTLAQANARLLAEESALRQQIQDLRNRSLRVLNVQAILELGILEAECQLSKCFDLMFDRNGALLTTGAEGADQTKGFWMECWEEVKAGFAGKERKRFVGTLSVKFLARYGVDMQKLLLKRDDTAKVFFVANAEPAYLGSKGFPETEWQGCVSLRQTWEGDWVADDQAMTIESWCKDVCRKDLEESLRVGPESLNWLKVPLKNTVKHLLQMLVAPPGYTVAIVDEPSPDFAPFFEYAAQLGLEKPVLPPATENLT